MPRLVIEIMFSECNQCRYQYFSNEMRSCWKCHRSYCRVSCHESHIFKRVANIKGHVCYRDECCHCTDIVSRREYTDRQLINFLLNPHDGYGGEISRACNSLGALLVERGLLISDNSVPCGACDRQPREAERAEFVARGYVCEECYTKHKLNCESDSE